MRHIMRPYAQLYHPSDVEEAVRLCGATCGPAALAAILQRQVTGVAPYLGDFPSRRHMTPTHMRQALLAADATVLVWHPAKAPSDDPRTYGLSFVQWEGPWLRPGVPVRAAYRHTHWVGVAHCAEYGRMIYDINARTEESAWGAWVPYAWWTAEVVPRIVETIPRATGGFYPRWVCTVALAHAQEDAIAPFLAREPSAHNVSQGESPLGS